MRNSDSSSSVWTVPPIWWDHPAVNPPSRGVQTSVPCSSHRPLFVPVSDSSNLPHGESATVEDGGICSYSTVERFSCSTKTDEAGQPRRKCERMRQVLRHCRGRPTEVIESSTEETEDSEEEGLDGGNFRERGVTVKEGFGQPWDDEWFRGFGRPMLPMERRDEGESEPFVWKQEPDRRQPDQSQPSIGDFRDVPENVLREIFKAWEEGKDFGSGMLSELEDFLRAAEGMAQDILGQFGGSPEEGQKGGQGAEGGLWGRGGEGGIWGRLPDYRGREGGRWSSSPEVSQGGEEGKGAGKLDRFLKWFRGEGNGRGSGRSGWSGRREEEERAASQYRDYAHSFEEV